MKLIIILLNLAIINLSQAKKIAPQNIEELVNNFKKSNYISGSILVAKGKEVIYKNALGYANYRFNVFNTIYTKHSLASLSKQFTAAGIMRLVDQKLIKLDDSIIKYFPEAPETWKEITLHHLLTHTSGLVSWVYEGRREMSTYAAQDFNERFKVLIQAPLKFSPGEKWEYSSIAYSVLAGIIRKVSGLKYEEFMRNEFYVPLSMTNTDEGYEGINIYDHGRTYQNKTIKNLSHGYVIKNGQWTDEIIYYIKGTAAAGMGYTHSTVYDLLHWFTELKNNNVLSKESTSKLFRQYSKTTYKLHSPEVSYYGYGWMSINRQDDKIIHHTGYSGTGHSSIYLYSQKHDLSIIILANVIEAKKNSFYSKKMAMDILDLFDNQEIK